MNEGLLIKDLKSIDIEEVLTIIKRNEEPKALQATLSALQDVKLNLFNSL